MLLSVSIIKQKQINIRSCLQLWEKWPCVISDIFPYFCVAWTDASTASPSLKNTRRDLLWLERHLDLETGTECSSVCVCSPYSTTAKDAFHADARLDVWVRAQTAMLYKHTRGETAKMHEWNVSDACNPPGALRFTQRQSSLLTAACTARICNPEQATY